jgi:hypothetical protein
MNQPTCPTAHPTRSPAAAVQVPFNTHENATRATGRYGAVIVKSPNKDMGVDECLRDHRYMGTNASEDDRNGRLKSGDNA